MHTLQVLPYEVYWCDLVTLPGALAHPTMQPDDVLMCVLRGCVCKACSLHLKYLKHISYDICICVDRVVECVLVLSRDWAHAHMHV